MSQLQDLLSPRLLINEIPDYRQLASCIDLLAFYISSESINLLIFTIDQKLANNLAAVIQIRLEEFQLYKLFPARPAHTKNKFYIKKLHNQHEAFLESVKIHRLSRDWQYDRYSSIGFYIHDRRGDWMRIWRLTKLYDNQPEHYFQTVLQSSTSLSRAASLTTS